MPRSFAIAVPVGAYHRFLPAALRSLSAQDVPLQVALLDASGDARVARLAEEHGDVVTYFRSGPDGGQAAAIVEGWQHLDGDLVGWLNADDRLFPGALKTVLARFEAEGSPQAVYGHSTILDATGATTGWQWSVEPPSAMLRRSAIISQPSCFLTRDACDQIGGLDPSLHYTMDWDLFVRLYDAGGRFDFVPDALSAVLWEVGTKTASFTGQRRRELRRIANLYAGDQRAGLLRAFALQHLIDKLPDRARRSVLNALAGDTKTIEGLAPDGRMPGRSATLPLVHYQDEARDRIYVEATGEGAVTLAAADGTRVELDWTNGRGVGRLAAPVPAACRVDLRIDALKSTRLIRIGFDDSPRGTSAASLRRHAERSEQSA